MLRPRSSRHLCKQSGAALLVLMLIVLLASLSLFLNRFASRPSTINDLKTMQTLAQAKEAIIGWSASKASTPGMLPCPEDTTLIGTINEGQAQSTCGNTLQVGRLPWRTLGLPDLRDSSGEKLWYAISPGFRYSPINTDKPALLIVDDIANSAVAIIFSPGAVLPSQNRAVPTAATPPDVTQYLDLLNSSGTGKFVTTGDVAQFNDRILAISHRDLFNAVEKRVGREVRLALLNHYCGVNNFNEAGACITAGGNRFFPRPANFNDLTCLGHAKIDSVKCTSGTVNNSGRIPANPTISWEPTLSLLRGTIASEPPNWFQANGWRELVYYAVANACIDGTTNCNGNGKLTANQPPGTPVTNQRAIIIATGRALNTTTPAQDRSSDASKSNIANYLEEENLLPLDDIYTRLPTNPNTPFNDQVFLLP